MKKLLYPAVAVMLFAGACTKKQSTIVPPPVTDTVYVDTANQMPDTTILVSGVSDIRMESWSDITVPIMVSHVNSPGQKVTMMINGLPENVVAKWSSETGYTNFTTMLTLNTEFVQPGLYPISILCKTEKGLSRQYSIDLMVDSMTDRDCNTELANSIVTGSFSMEDAVLDTVLNMQGVYIYNSIPKKQLFLNNIYFSYGADPTKQFGYNGPNGWEQVKVSFDCATGIVTMPEQEVVGARQSNGDLKTIKLSGIGKYDTESGMLELTYLSEYDEAGTIIQKTLKLKAEGVK